MDIEKKYYSIKEVAEQFEVATSLIRFWEKQFPTISPRKNGKGARLYTKSDIKEIKKVYQLVKEKGFTLGGAKQVIEKEKKGDEAVVTAMQSVAKLEEIKAFLVKLKSDLE